MLELKILNVHLSHGMYNLDQLFNFYEHGLITNDILLFQLFIEQIEELSDLFSISGLNNMHFVFMINQFRICLNTFI